MRKIVVYPNPVLRQIAKKITDINGQLMDEINDIKEVLRSSDLGAGLAAPQLGISKRIFGLKDWETKKVRIFINPEIVETVGDASFVVIVDDEGKKHDFLDGCLSVPGFYGTDKRFLKIKAKWSELEGDKLVEKKAILNGFESLVYQHEHDHLEGILFIDRIKADNGKFYKQVGEDMVPWKVEKVIEEEFSVKKS